VTRRMVASPPVNKKQTKERNETSQTVTLKVVKKCPIDVQAWAVVAIATPKVNKRNLDDE